MIQVLVTIRFGRDPMGTAPGAETGGGRDGTLPAAMKWSGACHFEGSAAMSGPQGKKERSIQSRLVMLLLFVLIPVLTLQGYIYYDTYQTRRASELQTNLEIARAVAKTFESFVEDILHHELVIGLAITSSQPMTSGDITRLLTSARGYVAVRDFTWMNSNGDAIYSGNPSVVGRNYSDRSYIRDIANGREWAVSELLISKATGQPVFGISRGIRDEKGKLLGIVVAMIIPEHLDARLAVERSTGGGHALVDHKGMMVYRYPAIQATWEERNWLKQYPEFGVALGGKETTATVYAPYEGKSRFIGLTPVSSIGWAAGAGRTEDEVTGPILARMANNALLFLSVSFAAFMIALVISRKITNPITTLVSHANALGNGQATEQVGPQDISEFRNLADAFHAMAVKVQEREAELRESEEKYRNLFANMVEEVHFWRVVRDKAGRVKTWRLVDANPPALKSWGRQTVDEIKGKTTDEIFGPGSTEHYLPVVQKIMTEGVSHTYEDYFPNLDKHFRFTSVPLGEFFITTGADITRVKTAQEQVERAYGRLKTFFDVRIGGIGIVIARADGSVLQANDYYLDILGHTRQEFEAGKVTWIERTPPEWLPADERALAQLRDRGACDPYEKEYVRRDGTRVPVLITDVMMPGLEKDILAIVINMTERKRAEEALKGAKESLEKRVRERTMALQILTEQLEGSRGDLRKLASELVRAEERERKRIAGVLHDEIAQTLAAARMRLDLIDGIPSGSAEGHDGGQGAPPAVDPGDARADERHRQPPSLRHGAEGRLRCARQKIDGEIPRSDRLRHTGCVQAPRSGREDDSVPGRAGVAEQRREAQQCEERPCPDRHGKRQLPRFGHGRRRGVRPPGARGAHRRGRVRAVQHEGAADCRGREPPDRVLPGERHGSDGHSARGPGLIAEMRGKIPTTNGRRETS